MKNNNNEIIFEAQRLYSEERLTFRQISRILKINLSDAIHYCTDIKYKQLKTITNEK